MKVSLVRTVHDLHRKIRTVHDNLFFSILRPSFEGHKIYLSTSPNYDLGNFRKLVGDVTQELKRISGSVAKIEAKIRPFRPDLADLIKDLESDERRNLQLVAKLQLAKQDLKSAPRDEGKISNVLGITAELRSNEKKIHTISDLIRKQVLLDN